MTELFNSSFVLLNQHAESSGFKYVWLCAVTPGKVMRNGCKHVRLMMRARRGRSCRAVSYSFCRCLAQSLVTTCPNELHCFCLALSELDSSSLCPICADMDHLMLLWGLGERAPKRQPLLISEYAHAAAKASVLQFVSVNLFTIPCICLFFP